ncbi:MAG: 30S ribosomal protein S6 [Blastocatellia bacterium]|nr:30S ribosomal protein S6 [Blastocatellia bacterium]
MALRTYEVMYIVDPETPVDRIEKLNEAVGKLVEKEGGEVVRMDDIGLKNLAYPIQKKDTGHYVLFEINGTGQEILELERRMRVNDMIMRYITVRVDEDRRKAAAIRDRREAKNAKRKSFAPVVEEATTEEAAAE